MIARPVRTVSRSVSRGISRGLDGIVRPSGLTFLLYHQVGGGTGRSVDLSVDDFRAQMAHVAEQQRAVRLDDAVDELSDPAAPVRSGVVVTIDDGTADVTDVMVPVLAEFGVHATLYLASAFVDEGRPFPWGARPTSWAALRDALSSGFLSVECHTHTHPLMHRMTHDEAASEIERSIGVITDRLGVTPRHFAYPRAVLGSGAAESVVRTRFTSAVLASSRPNRPGAVDLHRIARTPIQRDDSNRFDRLSSGGGWFDGMVRASATALGHRRAS